MRKKLFLPLFLMASLCFAQAPTGYYSSATGSGYNLKTQLKNIIDNINDNNGLPFHDTSVTYGDLWDLYKTSDVRSDGKVWDIYSSCNFTFTTDQDTGSGGTSECDKYNREHTFPQSWYGGSNSHPLRADAHHVFPSDKKVNNIRGNIAFGEVLTKDYESNNGSKRGTSNIFGPTDKVFEPIDEFKGDIARALFYVATRYEDEIDSWENNNNGANDMLDGSSNKVFEQWSLEMLFKWHSEDPVSQKEIDRNEEIFTHQNNRNPFIDHPEYVSEIWSSVLSNETFSATDFKMYPNPNTNGTLYFKTTTSLSVKVFNVLGKVVATQNIDADSNSFDISLLPKGVYLVKVNSGSSSITKKLIKR